MFKDKKINKYARTLLSINYFVIDTFKYKTYTYVSNKSRDPLKRVMTVPDPSGQCITIRN